MSNEKIKLPKMEWETEKKFPGAVFLILFFRNGLRHVQADPATKKSN